MNITGDCDGPHRKEGRFCYLAVQGLGMLADAKTRALWHRDRS